MQDRFSLKHRWARACAIAFMPMLGIQSSMAASMHVAPVRVVLTPERSIAALTLGNAEDHEIAVQAEVVRWTQQDGQDVYETTRDVVVNPAIFRVRGRGQQIVRLGLQVPAGKTEAAYRIFLQQLPREISTGSGEGALRLQTLLRIGVPIFVPPLQPQARLNWRLQPDESRPGQTLLSLDNQGNEHLQMTQVVVRRAGSSELTRKSMSLYVLPGQSGSVALLLPTLAPETALQIDVASDSPTPLPPIDIRLPRAAAASAAP